MVVVEGAEVAAVAEAAEVAVTGKMNVINIEMRVAASNVTAKITCLRTAPLRKLSWRGRRKATLREDILGGTEMEHGLSLMELLHSTRCPCRIQLPGQTDSCSVLLRTAPGEMNQQELDSLLMSDPGMWLHRTCLSLRSHLREV